MRCSWKAGFVSRFSLFFYQQHEGVDRCCTIQVAKKVLANQPAANTITKIQTQCPLRRSFAITHCIYPMQMERQLVAGPRTAQKMEFTIRVPVAVNSTGINQTKSRMRKYTKRTLSSNDDCHVPVVVKNHSWVDLNERWSLGFLRLKTKPAGLSTTAK